MTLAVSTKPAIDWPVFLFMAAVHGLALLALLPTNFNWPAVFVMVFLYWVTGCLGITLGWHRMISHRSFTSPKWFEYFLVFCGSLACQHGPIEWVGLHRHHHAYSDQPNDHHDSNKGFWWSHMDWLVREVPAKAEIPRFTRDIASDPFYRFCNRWFLAFQIPLAIALYYWGEAWVGNGVSFVLWGIFARLVLTYHCTWFVNSATHKFGYRTFEDSGDKSTNCWWVALLTFGEGWHNNHHMYQYSARHGLMWWEFDLTWLIISGLERLGLARNIKLAPQPQLR